MHKKTKALKAAFPHTIPVMMGYVFMGMAFGMLLQSKGYHFGWALLMSLSIYGGSMQFIAVNFLANAVPMMDIIFITLMINLRQVFYGLTMLNTFKGTGRKKPYLIFSLTDETYSLLYSVKPPKDVDRGWFMFFLSLLDHSYWVIGCTLGGILGSFSLFNTKGIDFAMTALFVVIFVDQWKSSNNHFPAMAGVALGAACLMIFGAENFILPAMLSIVAVLMLFRKPMEEKEAQHDVEC